MKLLTFFMIITFTHQALSQAYHAQDPKWVDLTGKKYNGADVDLHNFKITQPSIACDSLTQKCAVTWNSTKKRSAPYNCYDKCNKERLKSYKINFQVKNRHEKVILSKHYKWDKDVHKADNGYIPATSIYAYWGKDINTNYATVYYWATDIKWENDKK